MKILFTSPGRRVELLQFFKRKNIEIICGDYDPSSPADYFADKVYKLPKEIDEGYFREVSRIAKYENVMLVIPLIDPEVELYSKNKSIAPSENVKIMISPWESVKICRDKYRLYSYFLETKVDLVPTCLGDDINCIKKLKGDLFILKPRSGSASKGIFIVQRKTFLDVMENFWELFNADPESYIVQIYIEDRVEVTVDILNDLSGRMLGLCQRKRLKVRGGEVERGVTIHDSRIENLSLEIVKHMKFEGVINIQFIVDKRNGDVYLSEINPRFGGGYPLSYHAGADFIDPLIDMYSGKKMDREIIRCRENVYMLRYDSAVYIDSLLKLTELKGEDG